MELYEVLYHEGEEELKKYVLAVSEEDLEAFLAEQNLDQMAFILVATDPETTFPLGAQQLTKAEDGRWDETVPA